MKRLLYGTINFVTNKNQTLIFLIIAILLIRVLFLNLDCALCMEEGEGRASSSNIPNIITTSPAESDVSLIADVPVEEDSVPQFALDLLERAPLAKKPKPNRPGVLGGLIDYMSEHNINLVRPKSPSRQSPVGVRENTPSTRAVACTRAVASLTSYFGSLQDCKLRPWHLVASTCHGQMPILFIKEPHTCPVINLFIISCDASHCTRPIMPSIKEVVHKWLAEPKQINYSELCNGISEVLYDTKFSKNDAHLLLEDVFKTSDLLKRYSKACIQLVSFVSRLPSRQN